MEKIIGLFETIFFCIFSYIIPKDKKLILFGSMKGKYIGGNPKAFYLYLQEIYKFDGKLLYYYGTQNPTLDGEINTYGDTYKKYWLLLRAKYLFIDSCSFDLGIKGVFFGNFEVIQMWHGEPIKKIGFLSELYISRRNKVVLFFEKLEYKNYKYILSNFGSKDIIAGAFRNENVLNIGLPRNDVLINHAFLKIYNNSTLESKLQGYKEKFSKVVLFSPTFRELNQEPYFSSDQLIELNQILKETNTLCIIKLHPNEKRIFLGDIKYSNIENVTNLLNYDSTDFLPFVDYLITDYSSIYIDFLLTGKPICWYQNDLNEYITSERGLLYSPAEVFIKDTTANNFSEFTIILKNIHSITNSSQYKNSYDHLRQKFYGNYSHTYSSSSELAKILFPTP